MEKEKWMAKEGREPGKGDNMVHATCYGEQRTGPGAENKHVEEENQNQEESAFRGLSGKGRCPVLHKAVSLCCANGSAAEISFISLMHLSVYLT